MEQIVIQAETTVNPTETEEKVKAAVNNLFGNLTFTSQPAGKQTLLTATATGQDSLIKFRNLLRSDRIRDASRKFLFKKIRGNTISFCLNKQVANAGHVSFCEENAESPLGPIKVTVTSEAPRQLIEWLAQKST